MVPPRCNEPLWFNLRRDLVSACSAHRNPNAIGTAAQENFKRSKQQDRSPARQRFLSLSKNGLT
jgi:hypothetical protein